jgi:DNA-directed RNA polymerase specialized sigma24 family protein
MEDLVKRQILARKATAYATGSDFCRIFAEDMKNLYLLSLLLTADAEKAEECFVSGFGDCSGENHVFKEWARSWARRAIIQNAIRLVAPGSQGNGDRKPADVARSQNAGGGQDSAAVPAELSAVLALRPLERFAFVLSVLEGYSDQQCALLLGCTRQEAIAARSAALQQIAQATDAENLNQFRIDTVHSKRNSITELAVPTRLATPA